MAPEQLLGRTGRPADIYAASVVLWEALTGQRLFDGEDHGTVLSKLMAREISPPSSVNAQLSKDIDALVMRGLAQEPSERFATAGEMARAVEEIVGVVTPSEVGAWVQTVAKDALHKRLRRVEALESVEVASVSNVNLLATGGPAPDPFADGVPDSAAPSSDDPTAAVERGPVPSRFEAAGASNRRWKAAAFVAPALGLLILGMSLGSVIRRSVTAPTAGAGARAPATGEAAADSRSLPPRPESETLQEDPLGGADFVVEPAEVVAGPDIKRATPVRAPRTVKPPGPMGRDHRRPPTPTPAAALPDCGIPYTVDAAGIRHPKPECL
jgi:serine/threonine-protein kinase